MNLGSPQSTAHARRAMSLLTRIRDFFVEPFADDLPAEATEPIAKSLGGDVPQMPPTPATAPIGSPGLAVYSGYVATNERSPDLASGTQRQQKYAEWIRVVPEVGAAARASLILAGSPEWDVQPYKADDADEPLPEDVERAAWLKRQISNMDDTPWSRVVQEHALAAFLGATFSVWTAKVVGGVFGLADIMTLPLSTIERYDLDERGKLRGIVQRDTQSTAEIPIARERLVYSRDIPTTTNPAGDGALRFLAETIRRKLLLEELRDKGYEKDVNGVPVIWAPIEEELAKVGTSKLNGDVYTMADFEAAMESVRTFAGAKKRTGAGIVMPSGTFPDVEGNPSSVRRYDAKVLTAQASSFAELSKTIDNLSWYLLAMIGFEYLAMGRSNGTQAMHVSKMEAAIRFVSSLLNNFAETFRRDVVRWLWILNGWDPKNPADPQNLPTLTWDALELVDVPALVNSIAQMLMAAGATPEQVLPIANRILENSGLPPLAEIDPAVVAMAREDALDRAGVTRKPAPDDSPDPPDDLTDPEED